MITLAKKVGKLLTNHYQSADLKTSLKSDHSPVTNADNAADKLITSTIKARYPDDFIISEEMNPSYPVSGDGDNRAVWIVDPLDGTTNFSLGLPLWGTSIARLINGVPEAAVLYFPMLNELYSAEHGKGAYLNDHQLHVRSHLDDLPITFFACCSRTFRRYHVSVPYKTRILGSAVYSLCSVARGIAILGFEATPKIWDIAGGWLLVKEAGGTMRTLDDSEPFPLKSGVNYSTQSYPTMAASASAIAQKAQKQISRK